MPSIRHFSNRFTLNVGNRCNVNYVMSLFSVSDDLNRPFSNKEGNVGDTSLGKRHGENYLLSLSKKKKITGNPIGTLIIIQNFFMFLFFHVPGPSIYIWE